MNKILSRPSESYEDHIRKCYDAYLILGKDNIINTMIDKLSVSENVYEYKGLIYKAVIDVLLLHDEGKKNPYFQKYIGNEMDYYGKYNWNKINKEHSIISTYYYLEKYYNIINSLECKKKTKKIIKEIICVFSMIVKSHHGNLNIYNKADIFQSIKNKANLYKDMFFAGYNEEVIEYYKNGIYDFKGNDIYLLSKYVFSMLVTCDFMAVHEFKTGNSLKINSIDVDKKNKFKERLNTNTIIQNIRLFEKGVLNIEGVNKYRSEMFLEAEKNILKYKDGRMYYLEAPTGCGKSLTALNLTLSMLDNTYNKIIYVAPFQNIIEQTYQDIKKIIGNENKDVVSVSCKEEIVTNEIHCEDENYEDYSIDNMDRLLLNYPFTIISHVRLFDALISCKRKDCMMTTLMSNSIIVLDEIQSYKNELWIPIINLLKDVVENLNIKIVIMSATLPKLDKLLEDKMFQVKNLINRKDYYYDFFKTRCDSDFSLLYRYNEDRELMKEIVIDKILDVAATGKRILVGTITRRTCEELYQKLIKENLQGYEIYKIDSCTSLINKEYIINKLKKKNKENKYELKNVILVATQCIEAGVDIDMEIGFKNIGILDSDEQFSGRIQRNFIDKGIVYYFKIDEVGKIYRGDYRSERTLLDHRWQDILKNKKFEIFYNMCYDRLIRYKNKQNIEIDNYKKKLDFASIYNKMKLIDEDNKVNLLMMCKIKTNKNILDLKSEINTYNKIKESNIDYAEKEVKLSRFKKIFDMFTYSVSVFDQDKIISSGNFGSYKIIEDAEQYYTNVEHGCITNKSEINLEKLLNKSMWI